MAQATSREPGIPRTSSELRAFCARHRLSRQAVAQHYGASPQRVSQLLCDWPCRRDTLARLREAIGAALTERGKDTPPLRQSQRGRVGAGGGVEVERGAGGEGGA